MKKWILFVFTASATLYFIIMYESQEAYRLLFAETAWFVFSLIYLYNGKRNIRAYIPDNVRVVNKGAEIPIQVFAENMGKLPMPFIKIYVKVDGKQISESFSCSLKGGEKRNENLYMKAEHAGLCRIEVSKVVCYDPLHVFDGKKGGNKGISVFVLPRIYPVAMEIQSAFRYFGDESGLYYEDEEGSDPSEILEIREYRLGDRLQKIHWKLSQRTDTLMVKEYSEPIGFAVVFLLDTSKLHEAYLETFMSISMEMCQEKCLHYLCYMDADGVLIRKPIVREENLYLFLQSVWGIGAESNMKAEKNADRGKQKREANQRCRNFDESVYNDWYGRGSYHTCLRLTENLELYKQEELVGKIDGQDVEKGLARLPLEL